MKSLKKWLKERWLKNRGWTKSWYPFQMDDPFLAAGRAMRFGTTRIC